MSKPNEKRCPDCGEAKPLDGFHRNRSARDGRASYCRPCWLAREAQRRKKVSEAPKPPITEKHCSGCGECKPVAHFTPSAYTKDGYLPECKACMRVYYAERRSDPVVRAACADSNRKAHYRRKYGITVEQYEAMLDTQGGACAICGVSRAESERRFAVDHCHDSGRVRGILCDHCNRLLSRMERDPDWLARAREYMAAPH